MIEKMASVYVIKTNDGVKIGRSARVFLRLCELRARTKGNPLSLSFAARCSSTAVTIAIEARAHEILAASRINGEWFSVSVNEAVAAVMQAAKEFGCLLHLMPIPTPIAGTKQISRGRPPRPGGPDPVVPVRFPRPVLAAVDAWVEKRGMETRSAAVIDLVERGLAAPAPRKRTAAPRRGS
jgi:hypothetical protein